MRARYNRMMTQLCLDEQTRAAMLASLRQAREEKRGISTLPARALLAACLVGALAAGALAMGLSGGWAAFFGQVPEKAVTPVQFSARSGAYTVALEETIVDESGAAFLLSLRRTDGGVIEGEPGLYDMRLDIADQPANMSFSYQEPIRSEDGRCVYYCFQFKHYNEELETLVGREILLTYQGITDKCWTQEEIQQVRLETVSLVPLAPAVEQAPVNFDIYADMEAPDFVAAMDLLNATAVPGTIPLTKRSAVAYSLAGGVLYRDGKTLALALYQSEGLDREGNYLTDGAEVAALTDTRTGERLSAPCAQWGEDPGCGVTFFALEQPLTLADLPYLSATVNYHTVKLLSDEPFTLLFPVTDSGYVKEYPLDRQVTVGFEKFSHGYDLHVTALQISALELRLPVDNVERREKDPSEHTPCTLIYDDGSEVPLKGGASVNVVDRPEADRHLTLRPAENVLLDPDRAAALQLGDICIQLK